MSAYRAAAPVPEEDLHALVLEAKDLVHRERLERRLESLARALTLRGRGAGSPSDPWSDGERGPTARGADRARGCLWPVALLLVPLLVFGTFCALFFWACASMARSWTEWRRYGRRYHPLPVSSACVALCAPIACGLALGSLMGAMPWQSPILWPTCVASLVCGAVAYYRREWSTDYRPWQRESASDRPRNGQS
jgi:hypothetical protein